MALLPHFGNFSFSVDFQMCTTPRGTPGVRAFVPPPDSLESQLEASGIIKDNYNLMQKLQYLSKDRRKKGSTFYVTGNSKDIYTLFNLCLIFLLLLTH